MLSVICCGTCSTELFHPTPRQVDALETGILNYLLWPSACKVIESLWDHSFSTLSAHRVDPHNITYALHASPWHMLQKHFDSKLWYSSLCKVQELASYCCGNTHSAEQRSPLDEYGEHVG